MDKAFGSSILIIGFLISLLLETNRVAFDKPTLYFIFGMIIGSIGRSVMKESD